MLHHQILRAEAAEEAPVLVLLHGLGSDESDLIGVAAELNLPYTTIAVRAPLTYSVAGYCWFNIGWSDEGVSMATGEVEESLAELELFMDQLPEMLSGLPRSLVLGGFSQGASMSLALGLRRPDLMHALLLLSGFVLPQFVPESVPALAGKAALVQHGLHDPLIPVEHGRNAAELLRAYGLVVTYQEFPMAHQVSLESLGEIRNWLMNLSQS